MKMFGGLRRLAHLQGTYNGWRARRRGRMRAVAGPGGEAVVLGRPIPPPRRAPLAGAPAATLITCSGCGWSAWVKAGDVVRIQTTAGRCTGHWAERGAS